MMYSQYFIVNADLLEFLASDNNLHDYVRVSSNGAFFLRSFYI